MGILEMTKTHILHQKIQIVLPTTNKGHQLLVLPVMTGCLTHLQIRLASLNTLMIQEQDNISLHNISGTASTLHHNIQSVRRIPFCPNMLSLLTITRILLIPAINILLLLQEPMASTMPHLQMRIVYRHHFLDLATHTRLHTTTPLPKRLHHVNVRLLPANTVARERSASKKAQRFSPHKTDFFWS
jgi:hypothetical protein